MPNPKPSEKSKGRVWPQPQRVAKAKAAPVQDYHIFDHRDPKSLVNMVPEKVSAAMKLVPLPYVNQSEKWLAKRAAPDPRLHALRLAFWSEYYRSIDEGMSSVNIAAVCRGICGTNFFYGVVLKDPFKLAFFISPPRDIAIKHEELMHLSLDKLREFVAKGDFFDVTTTEKRSKSGDRVVTTERKLNLGVMREIREIAKMATDRHMGTTISRHHILAQQMTDNPPLAQTPAYVDPEAIEKLEAHKETAQEQLEAEYEAEPEVFVDEEEGRAELGKPKTEEPEGYSESGGDE